MSFMCLVTLQSVYFEYGMIRIDADGKCFNSGEVIKLGVETCQGHSWSDTCLSANSLSCLALTPLWGRNVLAADVTGRWGKVKFITVFGAK